MLRRRKPSSDDREILALVERTLLPYTRIHFPRTKITMRELKRRLRHSDVYVDVAKYGTDKPRGFVSFRSAGPHLWIDMLSVNEAYRGRGLGAVLMNAAMAEGRRRGCQEVLLYVNLENEGAKRFYRKLGFEERGYVDNLKCNLFGMRLE